MNYLKMREFQLNAVMQEMNINVLRSKEAQWFVGQYGSYLILKTWNQHQREQPDFLGSENDFFGLNAGLSSLLALILSSQGNVVTNMGNNRSDPFILRLGGNPQQSRMPVINQPVPPIIEKNVNREEAIQSNPIKTQSSGFTQGFKAYTPNIISIQQATPENQTTTPIKSTSLKVQDDKLPLKSHLDDIREAVDDYARSDEKENKNPEVEIKEAVMLPSGLKSDPEQANELEEEDFNFSEVSSMDKYQKKLLL